MRDSPWQTFLIIILEEQMSFYAAPARMPLMILIPFIHPMS